MKTFSSALALALAGCTMASPGISAQLAQQFAKSDLVAIDLALIGPPSWERVCVLTPYTLNQQAETVLGFKWDAEGKTSIASNEGVTVLVFTSGAEVLAYAEHPRNQGDLSELQPRCLARAKAKVVRRAGADAWVYLVAPDAVTHELPPR